MKDDLQMILEDLTLEEKASLCSGKDFWHLKGIQRLDIPSIMVTDGPHGLRKQDGNTDHVGLSRSIPATCFPTASATASSWDIELIQTMGVALGEECLQEDVAVLLGPGANIKRSPLCGRNFEYISEDPYLTGQIGAALVKGVQSQGIGTSLKHFAANNQEYRRMVTESVVDERAFREIYLAGFETIVKESQPWTLMCGYNKVDSNFCSDNKRLLTDILKEEWGHEGLVVTDWGACNDRVEAIKAGMELEMPSSGGLNDQLIVKAVNEGRLSIEALDKAVIRVLELIKKSETNRKVDYKYDPEAHHKLARKIAGESSVLLKNDSNILPLDMSDDIGVIGEFATSPRYQGAGSSLINPSRMDSCLETFEALGIEYEFALGYEKSTDVVNEVLIEEAQVLAKEHDKVIIFAGLTDNYESEGFDRKHLKMPANQLALIKAVCEVNKNVIVVLQNGAPIEMPWLENVSGVLESYLGGQAGSSAAVDILFGITNPSGKLAETFPVSLEDDLASNWFSNSKLTVEYRESVYVGYRYYDSADKDVLFPFGYGLSYSEFEYSQLELSQSNIEDSDTIEVRFKVKNIGGVSGKEIVQLYVKDSQSTIYRPEKELKGFAKVSLEAGEEQVVKLELDKRSFAYYNVEAKDWHVESGDFEILVGGSSRDIRLSDSVYVKGNDDIIVPDYREKAPEYYDIANVSNSIKGNSFKTVLGRTIPANRLSKMAPYTMISTLGDVKSTLVGGKLHNMVESKFLEMADDLDDNDPTVLMMKAMVDDMPIRSMVLMGEGMLNFEMAEGLIQMMNGHFLKGGFTILKNKVKK